MKINKAPLSKVRQIFDDFENYGLWNDCIKEFKVISGDFKNPKTTPTMIELKFNENETLKAKLINNTLQDFQLKVKFLGDWICALSIDWCFVEEDGKTKVTNSVSTKGVFSAAIPFLIGFDLQKKLQNSDIELKNKVEMELTEE